MYLYIFDKQWEHLGHLLKVKEVILSALIILDVSLKEGILLGNVMFQLIDLHTNATKPHVRTK